MPYLGPSPVVTESGLIADPGNTPATRGDCLPYACFADGGQNTGARAWCSFWGFMDSYNCHNPACQPYLSQIPASGGCRAIAPQPPAFPVTPPIYVLNPTAPQPPRTSQVLSPQSLLRPLPQIVPQPSMNRSDVPSCGGVTGWVNGNPMMAGLALVGLYFLMRGR